MLFLVNRSVHHAEIRRVLAMAGQQATERRQALIEAPETTAPFSPALVQTVLRSVSYRLHSMEMEGLRALLKYAAKLEMCGARRRCGVLLTPNQESSRLSPV